MKILKKIQNIKEINREVQNEFQNRLDKIMKPVKSLGRLETIGAQIAGIKETCNYSVKKRKHFVFAADNGVEVEGVSSCPREFTRLVSESMLSGTGAIAILCKTYNVDFSLVDIGIDGKIKGKYSNFIDRKIAYGTKNLKNESAMSLEEVYKAFEISFDLVKKAKKKYSILSCGEMGIGNTTSSACLIYKILGGDLDFIVGLGSGINSETLQHKKMIIEKACERVKSQDIYEILAELGGYDLAGMVGFYLACAYYRVPVILDGYISLAAALVAYKINPKVKDFLIPSHQTEEKGSMLVYEHLNITPFLYMNMCLGEGTGSVLVYPILDSIKPIYKKMLTKDEVYKRYN